MTSPRPADDTTAPRPAEVALPGLPDGWSARTPALADVPRLVELRGEDKRPWTGSGTADRESVESEVAGPASWTRRQAVLLDPEGTVRAWVVVHDRAAGRTMLHVYVDRSVADVAVRRSVAAAAYSYVEAQAVEVCTLREIDETRLDASPFAADEEQRGWLAEAGYSHQRTWLQMTRPVEAGERFDRPREGVSIRRVEAHENGLPVATDLQTVHEMLEKSFQDHFNSYRESFPEFVQRLREDTGHRWDHWWLAFVDPEESGGRPEPAGAVVSTVLPVGASGHEGSYIDYIGVHRLARGRGVAKSLLHTVVADAAERGRDRVGLEVDDDSPTGANGLYESMGWRTDYVTESWFKQLRVREHAAGGSA